MDKLLWQCLVGEFVASFILASAGLFVVFLAVVCGGANAFEIGICFGTMVAMVIYATGSIGGAHFNPAVTLAVAIFRPFPWKWVLPYWAAQVLGWFTGSLALYGLCGNAITAYETAHNIVRGSMQSQATAMIFQCFTPHPLIASALHWSPKIAPIGIGILNEVFCTALLITIVFALLDERNEYKPNIKIFGLIVGLLAGVLIVVFGPLSMASFNPARDFGPRLATWLLGWGTMAFPGPGSGVGGYWYIYWIGPLLGAIMGGAVWDYVLAPCLPRKSIPVKADTNELTT